MKPCAYCGEPMTNPRRVQCGKPECKRLYRNEKMRRYFAAYKAKHGEPYTARYREKRREIDRAYRQRVPHWRQRNPERALQYEQRRGKRRQANADKIETFSRDEIFDRDRWRCGVCDKKINKRLRYPHPLSASLDHIVPLSEGGPHTRANTRATHLRCNVSRGARGGGEQLPLVG